MAKSYIVIKNNREVLGRYASKQGAEDAAEALRDNFPGAAFEFGKLDKKLYTTKTDATYTPVDEDY